jgi:hypothetical protein
MYKLILDYFLITQRAIIFSFVFILYATNPFSTALADTCKKKPSTLLLDLTVGSDAGFDNSGRNGTENILFAANSMNALFKILRTKGHLNTIQLLEFRKVSGILNNLHNTLLTGAYKQELYLYQNIKNKKIPTNALNTKTYKKIDRLMFKRLK